MSLPYLVLDCYYDERGAAPNFLALLGEREAHVVRCVYEAPPAEPRGYAGVLVSGSKGSLTTPEPWMPPLLDTLGAVHAAGLPMLGICFGHQAIARALLGPAAVRPAERTELGWVELELTESVELTEGLPRTFTCFASHFDEVTPGAAELAVFCRSERCPVEGYRVRGSDTWGLQFHPEMDPLESETLVRSNLARHVQLPQDVEATLARAADGRWLGRQVFANFLELAEGVKR
ncbi:MAG: type 1 glutamine amidotransferase [Planctomycetes bacterium]|nr:type 1 glutamine amidotransferase [Planctomycetota bacterium]